MSIALCLILGFMIGGIPFGIVLSKMLGGVDPRQTGSGTSGATNVSRVLGRKWGIVVLLLDALKGFLPVKFLAPLLMPEHALQGSLLIAVAAMAGHVWTPFAGFRGGKGVATAAGAMLAIDAVSLGLSMGLWVIAVAIFRFVSLGSLLTAIGFPVLAWRLHPEKMGVVYAGAIVALFLIYTHRQNLMRIVKGTESRLF